MTRDAPLRQAATALVGPAVWATHFLTIYASESLACRFGLPTLHDGTVAGATVIALVALALHMSDASRRDCAMGSEDPLERFLRRIALALDALSLVGIGWAALAAMLLTACN